ncbi:hypothetical protein SETIT_2G027700v2 [Setaria italica]|uniref:Uncharacterized protein n=1 Tax=Setaria italica TaxID=4555 RepID=A0A368PVE7_SETIT|nr:hypothetical protein SETIT_2G027700v2 [Setaria italica]
MASRFVLLSRAAIRSPASGGLLRRASAGPSTLGTITRAAQGLRHYAAGPPCSRADLNEAVANVQRTVNSIEAKVSDVARRLDALEAPRRHEQYVRATFQGLRDPESTHIQYMQIGVIFGLIASFLVHFWVRKTSRGSM